jgi:transcriptional regulator with XRE-family HTH domain
VSIGGEVAEGASARLIHTPGLAGARVEPVQVVGEVARKRGRGQRPERLLDLAPALAAGLAHREHVLQGHTRQPDPVAQRTANACPCGLCARTGSVYGATPSVLPWREDTTDRSPAPIDALDCVMYIDGMKAFRQARDRRGVSQRRLAEQAGVSFRALQMIEAGETDARLSSLMKIAAALGTPGPVVQTELDHLIAEDPDSVVAISRKIRAEGDASWKLWLFELVDAFRRCPTDELVAVPPGRDTSDRIRSLLASTVETLCEERGLHSPWWCAGFGALATPWFVAGVENLKALALVESPTHFRKRNIFVLANFLSRA